jgi:CheY-like chemotaxis protein
MTVPLKTRILLADDHEVVRGGLRMVLDSAPDLEVVAEAGDGAEAVELALSEEVDLAVLDVTMPRMTGLQAALELSRRKPVGGHIAAGRRPVSRAGSAARRGASRCRRGVCAMRTSLSGAGLDRRAPPLAEPARRAPRPGPRRWRSVVVRGQPAAGGAG